MGTSKVPVPPSAVRQHPLRSSYINTVGEIEGGSVGDKAADELANVDGNAVGAFGMTVGNDVGLAVGNAVGAVGEAVGDDVGLVVGGEEGAKLGAAVGAHVHALQ